MSRGVSLSPLSYHDGYSVLVLPEYKHRDVQKKYIQTMIHLARKDALLAKKNIERKPRKIGSRKQKSYVIVTAYSSTRDQTDTSPCITANGFNVCKHNRENVVAANFLAFGTRVRFPEMFGDKIFIVQDRMNQRYRQRVDIWMKSRKAAKKFGVKRLKLEVVPNHYAEQIHEAL